MVVWSCRACGNSFAVGDHGRWAWCTCGHFQVFEAAYKQKLQHARARLERCAAVARYFEGTQLAMWSSIWPAGHCAVSSLLLAPLLRAADEAGSWRVAVGVVAWTTSGSWGADYEGRWGMRAETFKAPLRHAWCESADGDVVDCTYGQFDLGDALVVLPASAAGDIGHYASVKLDLDSEELYRRSISPSGDGWRRTPGRTGMRALFDAVEGGW